MANMPTIYGDDWGMVYSHITIITMDPMEQGGMRKAQGANFPENQTGG